MSQPKDVVTWSVVDCLLISFFTASIPLMWVPLTIYLGNTSMFMIEMTELSLWLAATAAVGALILTLSLLFMPSWLRPWWGRVIFAVGVLLWLQANIFAWRMGVLDGSELKWSPDDIRGIIDISAWFIIVPMIVIAAKWCRKYARAIAMIMIAMQLGASLIAVYRVESQGVTQGSITIDESTKFHFSPKRNVVILVLDSFETILFNELLETDPALARIFDGFTYYPNIVGGYHSTSLAMPLILNGEILRQPETVLHLYQGCLHWRFASSSP